VPKERSNACVACGAPGLEEVRGEFKTQIDGPDGHSISLCVPQLTWRHCNSCGEDFLDDDASQAITAAHRSALKLLSAADIRSLRQRLGKTQAQMGELLGIGEKTYCRWESGTHFQSEAFDRYLRLLETPDVVARLNEIRLHKQGGSQSAPPRFEYVDPSAYESVSEVRKYSSPAAWFAEKTA
jgi:putative zinc finger/helix-turn-helix YgiT family protein